MRSVFGSSTIGGCNYGKKFQRRLFRSALSRELIARVDSRNLVDFGRGNELSKQADYPRHFPFDFRIFDCMAARFGIYDFQQTHLPFLDFLLREEKRT